MYIYIYIASNQNIYLTKVTCHLRSPSVIPFPKDLKESRGEVTTHVVGRRAEGLLSNSISHRS